MEQVKVKEEASRLEDTLLYEGNEDSINHSTMLKNAVKKATDPLILSELMKTHSSPGACLTVESFKRCDKENQ